MKQKSTRRRTSQETQEETERTQNKKDTQNNDFVLFLFDKSHMCTCHEAGVGSIGDQTNSSSCRHELTPKCVSAVGGALLKRGSRTAEIML